MFTTTNPNQVQQLEIDQVRATIRMRAPGWFVLGSELKFYFTEDIDTACTDGASVWFCPKFWASLNKPQRVFVWLHELFHIADKHHLRRGSRDAKLWNIAGDYVINLRLSKISDWCKMPRMGLIDAKFEGMNIFDVYALLEKQTGAGTGDDGTGSGSGSGLGDVIDGTFDSPAAQKAAENKLDAAIQRASITNRLFGSGSCDALEDIAAAARRANRGLASFLSQFVEASYPSAANWSRGNKRLASAGIYYPSIRNENLDAIAFAVDTSGSVSREEIERVGGVIANVFATSQFSVLHVVYFNGNVYRTDTYKHGQKFEIGKVQSGGTDFHCVFAAAKKLNVKALVMLTDGFAPTPPKPTFPVCWVLTETDCEYYAKPFGKKVSLAR